MAIWKLKGCPRCGGDVFLDRDEEQRWYEQCLQCSYMRELKKVAEFYEPSGEKEQEPALVGKNQRSRHSSSR